MTSPAIPITDIHIVTVPISSARTPTPWCMNMSSSLSRSDVLLLRGGVDGLRRRVGPDDEDRAVGVAQQLEADRAEERTRDVAVATVAGGDELGAVRQPDQRVGGAAGHGVHVDRDVWVLVP